MPPRVSQAPAAGQLPRASGRRVARTRVRDLTPRVTLARALSLHRSDLPSAFRKASPRPVLRWVGQWIAEPNPPLVSTRQFHGKWQTSETIVDTTVSAVPRRWRCMFEYWVEDDLP